MFSFVRRNQVLLSSFFSILFSFYILTAAAVGQIRSDPIGPLLLRLMRPLQVSIHATITWVGEVKEGLRTMGSLKLENEKLRERIVELEAQRNKLVETEASNRRLQELLELRSHLPSGAVAAAVIANSASSWSRSFILDKGSRHGVRKGMGVVSPLGVLGQIVDVTPDSSKVLLIEDVYSGVDVVVQRSRARGIVSGSMEGGPVLKYVKRSEDIQRGDRLVTSGLDGVFPKGLMVGTVTEVRQKHFGLFQYVGVALAVDPFEVEEVLVVSAEAPFTKN